MIEPAELPVRGSAAGPARKRRLGVVLFGTSIGTTLEWFDFGLYSAASALVFPAVFFPALSPATGVLVSFASFGVGMAIRPLGAAVFASLGDRIGRRRTMVLSLVLMGLASLGIGALPGYASWGPVAPFLLVALRCVQGFSLGGEGTAAQVMALEHAPARRRALFGSLVNLGSPLGQVLVSVVLLAMTALLGEEAFLAWGWRLPFFLGCALAVGGYFVRRGMDESPVFENAAARGGTSASPVRTVFRSHPRVIVRLTFLWVPNIACSYLVTTYSLEYLHGALGLPSGTGFALVLVTNLLGVAAVPLGGWLADRFGRKPVLYSFAALSLVGTLVYFPLLDTKSWPLMLLANAVTLVSDYVEFGVLAVLFAEPFPTSLRFSGHAAVYTLTNMVGGSPTPLVAALLLSVTGSPWSIALLLAAAYAVSLVLIHRTPETRDREFGAS